jgi:hypothetical protein
VHRSLAKRTAGDHPSAMSEQHHRRAKRDHRHAPPSARGGRPCVFPPWPLSDTAGRCRGPGGPGGGRDAAARPPGPANRRGGGARHTKIFRAVIAELQRTRRDLPRTPAGPRSAESGPIGGCPVSANSPAGLGLAAGLIASDAKLGQQISPHPAEADIRPRGFIRSPRRRWREASAVQ